MSAHAVITDDRGFEATVLHAQQPVLVDFWAPDCPPCRMIAPILEELAGEYHGRLRVVQVNVDDNPQVVNRYGIMAMPTLLFFKDGQEAQRLIGARPKAKLKAAIEEVLATIAAPVS